MFSFTDVKIRADSQPLTYMGGGQRRVMRREKGGTFSLFWTKLTRMKPVCVTERQKHYLDREVCVLHGASSTMTPLGKLEK